jgi:hypothetical protein
MKFPGRSFLYSAMAMSGLLTSSLALAANPTAANCFLGEVEPDINPKRPETRITIHCAHPDRWVVGATNIQLDIWDGDESLIEAGERYLKEEGGFRMSSDKSNTFYTLPEHRMIKLGIKTSALPKTGVARIHGTVDLMVEKDCLGQNAIEPVILKAFPSQLKPGNELAVPGYEQTARLREAGYYSNHKMMTFTGGFSFMGLEQPSDNVVETWSFGTQRFYVAKSSGPAVKMKLCPTETVQIPINIETVLR